MLFEALSGKRRRSTHRFQRAHPGGHRYEAAEKSIDEVAPHLPEALRSLIRDCLVTDKAQRLGSFDLVADRLASLMPALQSSGLGLSLQESGYTPPPPAVGDSPTPAPVASRSDSPGSKPMASPSPGIALPAGSGQASPLAMQITNPPVPESVSSPSFRLLRNMRARRNGACRCETIGGAVAVVALVIGAAAAFARIGQQPTSDGAATAKSGPTGTGATTAAAAPSPALPSTSASSGAVPVIAVDSLPVAAARAVPKGSGHLSIAASPGWCSISVDGIARGVTPVAAIELPPGAHRVDCAPPGGKTHGTTVSVADGSVTRYKFALDE